MYMPDSLFTGKIKIYLPTTSSTNAHAMELLAKTNPSEGTCIYTDFQSAGRGQIGRFWHSSHGKNVLISYIFYPGFLKVTDQFYLNIISSLAVRDTIMSYMDDVTIKWPNDVYVGEQKISGILVQNVLRGSQIKATVIGIGINVNESEFPSELPNPTSILGVIGRETRLDDVIQLLSSRLEYHYLRLKQAKYRDLMSDYYGALFRINTVAKYIDTEGNEFMAAIHSVDHQGKLILHTENGEKLTFGFREIHYVI